MFVSVYRLTHKYKFNFFTLFIPINHLHAVFCQQPIVEPEPDIETSAEVE